MNRLQTSRWRFAAVVLTAAALLALLVAASRLRPDGAAAPEPAAAERPSLFAGIEQRGAALGSPDAPLTLVEYADLQCPYCAQWARDALPTVVEDYVRAGSLRIVFNGMAFIGRDSDTALRTALAAGRQNRLWDVVHGLYERQGGENAGWVTDDLVRELAAAIPGLDGERLLSARWADDLDPELARAAAAADAAGVRGTPAFALGPTGGRLELLELESLGPEGIVPAIESALASR
jgi:protein-disulfide isomerase